MLGLFEYTEVDEFFEDNCGLDVLSSITSLRLLIESIVLFDNALGPDFFRSRFLVQTHPLFLQ